MNSDMSQQVYQMLRNGQQQAIEYNTLRDYAQRFGDLQQNPYFYEIVEAYRNQPNFIKSQEFSNMLQQNPYYYDIINAYANQPGFTRPQNTEGNPQQQQYTDKLKLMLQQPMARINSLNIGNRLLTGDIHPTSSSLGASL